MGIQMTSIESGSNKERFILNLFADFVYIGL